MLTEKENQYLKGLNILNLSNDNLRTSDYLGKGAFGKVMKGEYLNLAVAEKKMNFMNFVKEILVLKLVKHPNIPMLYGYSNKTQGECCLISELVQGMTLDKYIKLKKPSVVLLIIHMIDLASVLNYCHGLNLIHRDIKPENVMINNDLNVKLLDFGISKFAKRLDTDTQVVGSIVYMAPECFDIINTRSEESESTNVISNSRISYKVDVWAFGLLLYTLISGEKLYPGWEASKLRNFLYLKQDYKIQKEKIQNKEIALICELCCKADPNDRPMMGKVKERLIYALYNEIKQTDIDVNDIIGKADQKSVYFILSKMSSYLKDCLKIVPNIFNKSKNKLNVILKPNCMNHRNKINFSREIKANLDIIEERTISKNPNLENIKYNQLKNETKLKEEERRKKFNKKLDQLIELEKIDSSQGDSSFSDNSDNDDDDFLQGLILNSARSIKEGPKMSIHDFNKSTTVNGVKKYFGINND